MVLGVCTASPSGSETKMYSLFLLCDPRQHMHKRSLGHAHLYVSQFQGLTLTCEIILSFSCAIHGRDLPHCRGVPCTCTRGAWDPRDFAMSAMREGSVTSHKRQIIILERRILHFAQVTINSLSACYHRGRRSNFAYSNLSRNFFSDQKLCRMVWKYK